MELSADGFRFILGFEGLIFTSMWDVTNYAIGIGCHYPDYENQLSFSIANRKCSGAEFTEAEVAEIIHVFMVDFNANVSKNFTGCNPTQNQYDAIFSLYWNYGYGSKTIHNVVDKLKSNIPPQEISNYIASLSSNKSRRQKEAELFLGNGNKGSWQQVNLNKLTANRKTTYSDDEWVGICDGSYTPNSNAQSNVGMVGSSMPKPNVPRPIMASRGENTVYRMASVGDRNRNLLKTEEKRRNAFSTMVNNYSKSAPELGRDLIISEDMYGCEILKGEQNSKTFLSKKK